MRLLVGRYQSPVRRELKRDESMQCTTTESQSIESSTCAGANRERARSVIRNAEHFRERSWATGGESFHAGNSSIFQEPILDLHHAVNVDRSR